MLFYSSWDLWLWASVHSLTVRHTLWWTYIKYTWHVDICPLYPHAWRNNSTVSWTDCVSNPRHVFFIDCKLNIVSALLVSDRFMRHLVVIFQCQDLVSQSSSPLSHSDSYTCSMDPLLPTIDSVRRKGPESDYDLTSRQRPNDRSQPQVNLHPRFWQNFWKVPKL